MLVLMAHIEKNAASPSSHLSEGEAVPEQLEAVIMSCLEKSPDDRPQTAADLRQTLLSLDLHQNWKEADAQSWWQQHAPKSSLGDDKSESAITLEL